METSQRVYLFNDPIDYLNDQLRDRRKKQPDYSVSEWSRRLGFQNPSLLAQVLKRERKLKPALAGRLASDLKLRGRAREYFECIALNESSTSPAEKRVFMERIQKMRPKKYRKVKELSLETFSLIADWHHTALLEMLQLKNFAEDADALRDVLDPKLGKKSVQEAMRRLVDLGLWTRDTNGRLCRPHEEPNFLKDGISSEALVLHQTQMIERAKAAVTDQSADERWMRGSTIAVKKENCRAPGKSCAKRTSASSPSPLMETATSSTSSTRSSSG